jgi:hypothetical protein
MSLPRANTAAAADRGTLVSCSALSAALAAAAACSPCHAPPPTASPAPGGGGVEAIASCPRLMPTTVAAAAVVPLPPPALVTKYTPHLPPATAPQPLTLPMMRSRMLPSKDVGCCCHWCKREGWGSPLRRGLVIPLPAMPPPSPTHTLHLHLQSRPRVGSTLPIGHGPPGCLVPPPAKEGSRSARMQHVVLRAACVLRATHTWAGAERELATGDPPTGYKAGYKGRGACATVPELHKASTTLPALHLPLT